MSCIFQLSFFQCRADDKGAILLHLLKNVIKDTEQTVVFAATKHHVEYLSMVFINPYLFDYGTGFPLSRMTTNN